MLENSSETSMCWWIWAGDGSKISQKGAPIPKGVPTYYGANFSRKLHENEENWAEGGIQDLSM